MAVTEDEDRHWQMFQDRRQRRLEKAHQPNGDLPQTIDLSADEDDKDDNLNPQILLRKQLLQGN